MEAFLTLLAHLASDDHGERAVLLAVLQPGQWPALLCALRAAGRM